MLQNGYQLYAARALAGLSQVQLAKFSGLSATAIVALERKREASLSGSSVNTLTRIEKVLTEHGVRLVETDEGTGAIRVHA